jgi:plastocyanin
MLRTLFLLPVLGSAIAVAAGPGVTAKEVSCSGARPDLDIRMRSFMFDPSDASVPDGGVVKFTNDDAVPHTATNGVRGDASAGERFDSGSIDPGGSYCVEVRGNGDLPYFCRIHPGMKGMLRVGR